MLLRHCCWCGPGLRKKVVGGRHRGAESAENSKPCITWGSTTVVGGIPRPPGTGNEHVYSPNKAERQTETDYVQQNHTIKIIQ